MKIFTREEIYGYINVLGKSPTTLINQEMALLIRMAFDLHIDITVDEIRLVLGSPPHPDPEKGSKYIWELEEDIPSGVL